MFSRQSFLLLAGVVLMIVISYSRVCFSYDTSNVEQRDTFSSHVTGETNSQAPINQKKDEVIPSSVHISDKEQTETIANERPYYYLSDVTANFNPKSKTLTVSGFGGGIWEPMRAITLDLVNLFYDVPTSVKTIKYISYKRIENRWGEVTGKKIEYSKTAYRISYDRMIKTGFIPDTWINPYTNSVVTLLRSQKYSASDIVRIVDRDVEETMKKVLYNLGKP